MLPNSAVPTATKYKDAAHARVYATWVASLAWQNLSGNASKLIVTLLANYRPRTDRNGALQISGARAGALIGMSEAAGRRALDELVDGGWLTLEQFGKFRRDAPALYGLTMFPNAVTGAPASMAFLNQSDHLQPVTRDTYRNHP